MRIVAVLAVLGMLLAGCAPQGSSEALQVGDVTIDDDRIDAVAEPLAQRLAGSGVTGEIRQSVAELAVFLEVARRYAREQGVTPEEPDYEGIAAQFEVSPDDPYVRLNAEANAYLTALRENATGRTPTEEEIRDVFDRFVEIAGPVATLEQIRGELLAIPEYGKSLTLREELLAAMDRYGVTVSPRYQPLEFGLFVVSVTGGQLVLVSLPIGQQGTGAVRAVD